MQRPYHQNTSIGRDVTMFGTEAINVHHTQERRMGETEQARLTTGMTRQPTAIRHWLGTSMIWLGQAIAGKAARPQEDLATPASQTTHRLAPIC